MLEDPSPVGEQTDLVSFARTLMPACSMANFPGGGQDRVQQPGDPARGTTSPWGSAASSHLHLHGWLLRPLSLEQQSPGRRLHTIGRA